MGKFMLNGNEYFGGESSTLAGLSDVALSALSDGQILQWDATNQKFKNIPAKNIKNSNDVFTPSEKNTADQQRMISCLIGGSQVSGEHTVQFVKFTDQWQVVCGLIMSRSFIQAINYSKSNTDALFTSSVYDLGGNTSYKPTYNYNSSTHILSLAFKSYHYAWFIGFTNAEILC